MKRYSGSEVTASAGVVQCVTHPPKHSQGPLLSVCFLWVIALPVDLSVSYF